MYIFNLSPLPPARDALVTKHLDIGIIRCAVSDIVGVEVINMMVGFFVLEILPKNPKFWAPNQIDL